MSSSPGDGLPPEPPLFDGTEEDTERATAADVRRRVENRPTERMDVSRVDVGRIDTDRQAMPSALLPEAEHDSSREPLPSALLPPPGHDSSREPLPSALLPPPGHDSGREAIPSVMLHSPASDELRRELSDGGFARIDTLPDGFAAILQRRALRPGDMVGTRYKLLEVLGEGAMGDVFVAENLAIRSRVAVKVLKPELLANPEFRKRFQYEAQAVGSIEHPNVARFLDLVVGDPTFLVMEYVRGDTLSAVLAREHKMTVPRAVHLATRLAWGLDAAHAAGIIHRDLKPSNVILAADREQGETPKLIDFGLAKIAAVAATEQITRTGQIIGTPAYMSPEQISGREVDARSDVYALACLLYELITGRPPFAGSDDVQTLYRQLHEPAEPLSLNAPAIPAALDKVMHRALSKIPTERYPSMQELARALNGATEKRRNGGGSTGAQAALARAPAGGAPVKLAATLVLGALLASAAWWWRDHRAIVVAPATAALMVASTPPGAKVAVDGKEAPETTPALVLGVAPGAHQVRLTLPGHDPVVQRVELAAGKRALVEVVLPPATHSVTVETVPAGALVYVDGVLQIGQTPLTLALADDDFHHLRFERNGFEQATRSLAPDDRAPLVTVNLQPERQARGTLMLDSEVRAEVWVDGEDSGFVSPSVFRIPAGTHTVQLRDGKQPRSAPLAVQITAGEATRLSIKGLQ
jgi:serine/threonine-protein kinase